MKKAALWIGVAVLMVGFGVGGSLLWNRSGEVSQTAHVLEPVGFSAKDGTLPFTVSAQRYLSEATASSHLDYDSTNRLAYDAEYARDEHWNTAWCSSETAPTWMLSFDKETDLENVGIVPGYAADEAVFLKNNRVKTLAVFYDGSTEAAETLSFEDRYGMQFFELNVHGVHSIQLQIVESYPGSKYKDNCLSEVDFWSSWVEAQDAAAALADGAKTDEDNRKCEDGHPYDPASAGDFSVLKPDTQGAQGAHYLIGQWNVGFWIPAEYADYNVFQYAGSGSVHFSTENDTGCLPFGDVMGAYLSAWDFEADLPDGGVPDYMTKGSFSIGAISGNTYREEWFGGDALSYSFHFKNTAFTAASLACPLDADKSCSIRDEGFMHSLLGTLE